MRKGEVNINVHRVADYHETVLYFIENVKSEDVVCKFFGCGIKLRSQEICCGGYCVHHQQRERTIDLVDKYISK